MGRPPPLNTLYVFWSGKISLVLGFRQPTLLACRFAGLATFGFTTIFLALGIARIWYKQIFAIAALFPFYTLHWQSSS